MDILYGIALSMHFGMEGDYNEIHPHVRIQQDRYIAGAYYNSEDRISPYVGVQYTFDNVFVEGGIAGGYPALGGVIPYARAGYKLSDNTKVFVAPAGEVVDGETNIRAVIGFDITFK